MKVSHYSHETGPSDQSVGWSKLVRFYFRSDFFLTADTLNTAPQGGQTHTAQGQNAQPHNAAMLAAYQAAINSFNNNLQPQHAAPQGQQQAPRSAQSGSTDQPQPAQNQQPDQGNAAQAPMYAVHAPAMLAYMPVLVS